MKCWDCNSIENPYCGVDRFDHNKLDGSLIECQETNSSIVCVKLQDKSKWSSLVSIEIHHLDSANSRFYSLKQLRVMSDDFVNLEYQILVKTIRMKSLVQPANLMHATAIHRRNRKNQKNQEISIRPLPSPLVLITLQELYWLSFLNS